MDLHGELNLSIHIAWMQSM